MKRLLLVLAVAVLACGKPSKIVKRVADALDVEAPLGQPDNPQERERERFDQAWWQLQSFRALQAVRQAVRAAVQARSIQFVSGGKESFKNLDVNAINKSTVNVPITGDVHGPSVLKAQVYLDRAHFSVGAIDGRWGRNSAIAVWWWQRSHGMDATGEVDEATFRSLAAAGDYVEPLIEYRISEEDLKGPFRHIPDSVYDQQRLSCLCYQSLREELAEKFHSAEDFLELLNRDVKFSELRAGDAIIIPNVRSPITADQHDIGSVAVSIAGNSFNAFDASGNLIFHAPTTVGSIYDPSPHETLHVIKIIDHPHFHYDPTLYHEVPDSMPDAHLAPGPNSPVGVVWIALSKQHYGVHGTKDPESIGYTSSHGCVRLTNWDATEVQHRISEGVKVAFVDTERHRA